MAQPLMPDAVSHRRELVEPEAGACRLPRSACRSTRRQRWALAYTSHAGAEDQTQARCRYDPPSARPASSAYALPSLERWPG